MKTTSRISLRRSLAALVVAALVAVLALASSSPAQTAESVTLVSNTGQMHDSSPVINHSAAQQFTTGSDAGGL